jgi:hypothetical protein
LDRRGGRRIRHPRPRLFHHSRLSQSVR